jgi:hypothetical protein
MALKTVLAGVAGALIGGAIGYYLGYRSAVYEPIPITAYLYTKDKRMAINDILIIGQDELKIYTMVPQNTNPVSVQAVINGKPLGVHKWSIPETGYTYVINFGKIPENTPPGDYYAYTIVTMANGRKYISNFVFFNLKK